MKFYAVVFVLFLVAAISGSASAEFYQYTDEKGVVRFTDDPSLIPENQRENAQTHESVKSSYAPQEVAPQEVAPQEVAPQEVVPQEVVPQARETDSRAPEVPGSAAAGDAPGSKSVLSEMKTEAKELDTMREDLVKEYNAIVAEKEALGPPPPDNAKSGVIADYVYRANALNQKIDAYRERSKEFDEKVNAFNSRIIKQQPVF